MTLVLTLLLLAQTRELPQEPSRIDYQQGFGIEPRAAVWWPVLDGRFRADQGILWGVTEGTSVNLREDLDIGDGEALGTYELGLIETVLHGGRRATFERLTLSFWVHRWEGETTLDSAEVFNGDSFAAGETVESRFRVWSFGLDGAPIFETMDEGRMFAAMTVGMRVIEVTMGLSAPGRDTDERTRLFYLGPGLRAEWKTAEYFFASLRGGVYFSIGTVDEGWDWIFKDWLALAVDAAASVGVEYAHVRAEAGLRLAANAVDIAREGEFGSDSEDNRFNYIAAGPFVQLSIHW